MKIIALLTFILTTAIVGSSSLAAVPQLEFTPKNGFGGVSEGNGSLTLLFGKPQLFHVESHGNEQSDGTFRLEQRVTFQGKPPQDRVWILTTVSPNHYSATLSDAPGPVTGTTSGPRLSLQYRARGPLVMHQELQLMPDGKTIDNVGVVTLLGIAVGRLHETITRTNPSITSNNSFKPKPLRGFKTPSGYSGGSALFRR
ncbi:MAG: DUF3833 family protein [Luteimonas sp.]